MLKSCLTFILVGLLAVTVSAKQYSSASFSSETLSADIKNQILPSFTKKIFNSVTNYS